ncbi:MAG: tRNA threonylcarbamoyladenosine dehydratase [Clostridiales bacterium]|jgi:tRNA A37 threonylcarbamoyladenosine dehydratase|nr:tRNA threonylcarbamoyladenosine dehydratase [Clostridiales bacterium]
MPDQFSRTRMLLGDKAVRKLNNSRVILFGVGGVGSFAAEALARAGIGRIELVDNDVVGITNLNRQLAALHSTLGRKKVHVMKERIADINPNAAVTTHDVFLTADTAKTFDFSNYDYVLDAIDTVSAKLILADHCNKSGTPLISSMGTGNKLDPTQLYVTDIFNTSGDPLARIMRHELRKLGVNKLKVVCSREEPRKPVSGPEEKTARRSLPASISFVPPAAGMIMAGECIRDLVKDLI